MNDIDIDKLIDAVKPRPGLYNKNDNMYYSHKKFKAKMWKDVCREVCSNWDQLSPQDKVECEREIQKKWKNLRTCFTRELGIQKKEKEKIENGGRVKRRKKYEHFDRMVFLLNPEVGEYDANAIEAIEYDSDNDSDPLVNNSMEDFDDETNKNVQIVVEPKQEFSHIQQSPIFERNAVEDKVLDMLRDIKQDEEDEDRQFLLSLLPSFRKLGDKQKFEARIEILKVLKNITFQESMT